jgi:hypothetical protein
VFHSFKEVFLSFKEVLRFFKEMEGSYNELDRCFSAKPPFLCEKREKSPSPPELRPILTPCRLEPMYA